MYIYKNNEGKVLAMSQKRLYRPDDIESEEDIEIDRSEEVKNASLIKESLFVDKPPIESGIYAVKYMEARRYLDDKSRSESGYLHLILEAEDEGITIEQHANDIISRYEEVAIKERERRRKKRVLKNDNY